ncbi:MAG: hypothetical protein ACEQSA_05670 [Weeksellaceae bacterium]
MAVGIKEGTPVVNTIYPHNTDIHSHINPNIHQEVAVNHDDTAALGVAVFGFYTALSMETDSIDFEYFQGDEMRKARKHAYGLSTLGGMQENENLEIGPENLLPFHEIKLHDDIYQYTVSPNSPDIGVLITEYDLRETVGGNNTRLHTSSDGRPIFLQHTAEAYQRALASRAYEFFIHHNPDMYANLRTMIGDNAVRTEPRSNTRSPVLEDLLGFDYDTYQGSLVPGFSDLAYRRLYSDEPMSRTEAAKNHIINRNGIPTSILALGGMPTVTGSRDVVTTAALSFMRSYISHNSVFVDFDRRLELYQESKTYVDNLFPEEENADIKRLVNAQIGVCVSGNNIDQIRHEVTQLADKGCRSIRIYTTNPGPEVVDAARSICEIAAANNYQDEGFPFHLCVGPIVDYTQAQKLQEIAQTNGVALTLLVGHGGGENCTSLEGGAAANALEIMYQLSLDENFNDVAIGFEGGLGTLFGPWMGIIDVISKDGSLVRGGVENGYGLHVLHKNDIPVQPYHGSASAVTRAIEQAVSGGKVIRTLKSGQQAAVEGKPNYGKAAQHSPSIVNQFMTMRALVGRTLADQQCRSIDDAFKRIKKHGHNHRASSAAANYTAGHHRGV